MHLCGAGGVAIGPFPFSGPAVSKPRPAPARSATNANVGNTPFAMITTAAHSHWMTDVPLKDGPSAGLTAVSLVRMKLFMLHNRLVARTIGKLSSRGRRAVRSMLRTAIAL